MKYYASVIIQLVSIPLLYMTLYNIAIIFHKPTINNGSDRMDFYIFTLYFLTIFVLLTLPVLNFIILKINNEIISILLHIFWFIFIVWFTLGDLHYRPYDYGLILFCVGSTIISRPIIQTIYNS